MRRLERHRQIKRIIQEQRIGTQGELKQELEREGFVVTQATLSRDLREIGLLKLRDAQGRHYYSLATPEVGELDTSIPQYILSIDRAEFMLVIKTELGDANVLANLIDGENKMDILGTVAGADTLLVICKDVATAIAYEKLLG